MTVAVPVSATLWGLPAPSSVTFNVPFCVPEVVGRNVTLMVQEDPGANVSPQLLTWVYCPVTAIWLMFRAVVPVLFRVTAWDGLAVLMTWVANVNDVGVIEAALVVPVPESATV